MNVWLCPIKANSWRIIKQNNLFGAPPRGRKMLSKVKIGDLLAFYIVKPINGIVAIYKVVSDIFEDSKDIWGRNRYPYRIRIKPIPEFHRDDGKAIPLYHIYGSFNEKKGIIIEPFLKGVLLVKLNNDQFVILQDLFKRD